MIYDPHDFLPTWDKDLSGLALWLLLLLGLSFAGGPSPTGAQPAASALLTGCDGGAPQAAAHAAAPPVQTSVDAHRIVL